MTENITTKVVAPKTTGNIPLDKILIGHRYREDMGDIDGLINSIKQNGLISPVAVCEMEGTVTHTYRLLAGGRRCEAMKQLGHTTIAANIYPPDINELERLLIELAENVDRKDMTYEEQVRLTSRMHKAMVELKGEAKVHGTTKTGHSMTDTADLMGKKKSTISQDIQLADAIAVMPELGKCKNKHEAVKMLKKMVHDQQVKEVAEMVEAKQASTPLDKAHKQLIEAYNIGDFFEHKDSVPDNSVDLYDVDTPFAIALNDIKKGGDTDAYNEWKVEEFKEKIDIVLADAYRVLKPTGWLIWWFAYDPWFDTIAEAIEKAGFLMNRIPAIWIKPNGQTNAPHCYMASSHEPFFYARKSNAATIERQGRPNQFVFRPVSTASKIHPTEKPIEMLCSVYEVFLKPNSVVEIPFLGSGNGIPAANNLGSRAFGWDLGQIYKDRYTVKIANGNGKRYYSYGGVV